MSGGYVKLFRKFKNWEWYKDNNTKAVFLHLLLSATRQDIKYKGIWLYRGEYCISLRKLATETGTSVRGVRTAIERLKKTGEISQRATQLGTVYKVDNYGLYQGSENPKRHSSDTASDTVSDTVATQSEVNSGEGFSNHPNRKRHSDRHSDRHNNKNIYNKKLKQEKQESSHPLHITNIYKESEKEKNEREPSRFLKVETEYQNRVKPFHNLTERERLNDLTETYGEAAVLEGIQRTYQHGGRSIGYLETVVRGEDRKNNPVFGAEEAEKMIESGELDWLM